MHDKKHIVCKLCNEPQCLEKECLFLSYPHEITQGMKSLKQRIKNLTDSKKSLTLGDKNLTQGNNSLVDFRYLPAYFRGGKKFKPVTEKQDKKYIVCYICDEPKCLERECIFLSDHKITRSMQNYINFKYIPFETDNSKHISFKILYIHAVKLFWFSVVTAAIIFIVVFGGLPVLSTTFNSMQSQLPLQVYISIFGAGVTAVCLLMANLFGTDSEIAK